MKRILMEDAEIRKLFKEVSKDQRLIFERLASVETTAKNTHDCIKEFISQVPCRVHADKISDNTIKIEKSKLSIIMAITSIVISMCAVVGVIYSIVSVVDKV